MYDIIFEILYFWLGSGWSIGMSDVSCTSLSHIPIQANIYVMSVFG